MQHNRGGWRGELGRLEGRAARDTLGDQVAVIRFIVRIPLLPVRIALWFRGRARRRREMAAFAQESLDRGTLDPGRIAVEWLEAHPDEYPFGEYDPRRRRIEARFRRMIAGPGAGPREG